MNKLHFTDIGGYAQQKKEAMKVADFFKNYKTYKESGARLPRGIIFYGDPGTGKTMFAKVIASESNVKSFTLTTDDFYKESNISISIKNTFEEAKKAAPSIIIIDELDRLVSCEKGYNKGESDKQRETLRSLLTEIDAISDKEVLVIATVNKPINLVPDALVRNGRIEKHIEISKPNKEDRISILDIYLNSNEIFNGVSSQDVASYTANFTGAALEALINEVLIDCISKHKKAEFNDFLNPIEAIRTSGIQQKKLDDNDSIIYHELGHFITDYTLNGEIGMINVVPYGQSLGRYSILDVDAESRKKDSKTKVINHCITLIAGLVATEYFLKEPYMGACDDIERFTAAYLGLAKNGLLSEKESATYLLTKADFQASIPDSKSTLSENCGKFMKACKKKAKKIIKQNKAIINALYTELKAKSVLTHKEIEEIISSISKK